MKFAISKTLDRLRSTLEGFTRLKFADSASGGTGLSHNDLASVEHQQEMRFALQELRNLVLEAMNLEMTQRTDLAGDSEIEPFSWGSIHFASTDATDDLLGSGTVQVDLFSLSSYSTNIVQIDRHIIFN